MLVFIIQFLWDLTILQSNRSGHVSTTTDLWSVDQTKASFMGVTAHWIESDSSSMTWKLCSEVIVFKGISGRHTGTNLGQYFISVCECAGIIARDSSQVRTTLCFLELIA